MLLKKLLKICVNQCTSVAKKLFFAKGGANTVRSAVKSTQSLENLQVLQNRQCDAFARLVELNGALDLF